MGAINHRRVCLPAGEGAAHTSHTHARAAYRGGQV